MPSGSVRHLGAVVAIAAAYYAFAVGGKALLLTGPAGAFWPAAGLGIAVLYLGGLRWWPGLLLGDLGSLAGDVLSTDLAVPPGTALAQAVGDMAGLLVAAIILRRLAGPRAAMDRLQQVGAVLVAVATGAAISATVAMLSVRAGGLIEASVMREFWRSWWLGDVAGALVVVPLVLAWWPRPARALRRGRAWEGALMITAVVALSVTAVSADQPLTYLVFPAFIWAALRFGPQGGTLAVAIAVLIAVWAASNELGPFVEHAPTESALNLQLYITIAALTTLCLGAVVSERRRATLDLLDSRARILAASNAERRRIERDLHDGAQQRLVMLGVELGVAEDLMQRDPASSRAMLAKLEGDVEAALTDVRSLAAGIYPTVLADFGLAEALRSLARQSPTATSVEIHGDDRCRPETEAAVYFCCSEALQNAAKHTDAATTVSITLKRNGDLCFEVHDDGPGFSPQHVGSGQGLANMRDRIEAVGGTLDIRSTPGRGTSVIGRIARP